MSHGSPRLQVLVGVSEIADLAGVKGAAVVTNWRVRSPRFPEPKIGGSQPRFDLDEVVQWLRHDAPRGRQAPEVDADWLWPRIVDAYAREAGIGDVRPVLAALIAVRHLVGSGDEWRALVDEGDLGALRRAARAAERAAPTMRDELVRRLALGGPAADYLPHVATVLDSSTSDPEVQLAAVVDIEVGTVRHRPMRTRGALAGVMVGLADPRPDDAVLDPACGVGDLLVGCARRGVAAVCGQDLDADATFLAAVRLTLLGVRARLAAPGHDSILDDQFATERFDLVVVDPPVGSGAPPLGRWLEHAITHLAPQGRMVISMPLHELVTVRAARRRPDRRLADLLTKVVVSTPLCAAVVVPRGGRTDVTGPVVVLCLGGRPTDVVRIVSLLERPRDLSASEVADAVADAVEGRPTSVGVEVAVDTTDAPGFLVALTEAGELVEQRSANRRSIAAHHNLLPDAAVVAGPFDDTDPWSGSASRAEMSSWSDESRLAARLDPLMSTPMTSTRRSPTEPGLVPAQAQVRRGPAESVDAATDRLLAVLRARHDDLERAAPGLYEELLGAAARIRLAVGPTDDAPDDTRRR